MKKMIIFLCFCLNFVFCIYNVGQIVSTSDQNVVLNVCDETTEYSIGDEIKLSDWNGITNSTGDYHVIWLEMSASW